MLSIARLNPMRGLYHHIKKSLPPISTTEKEAIDAGDVDIEADVLSARNPFKRIANLPFPALTEAEQTFIEGPLETLLEMIDAYSIEKNADLPKEVWDYIKEAGFFSMIVPQAFGGLGFSARAQSDIVSRIATRSITAAVTVMVPNSLGPAELLLHHGTNEQQQYYLPRLASGIEIPCFALTSTLAGSDASNLIDTATVVSRDIDGKQTLFLEVTVEKRYITLAPVATLVGLAVRLYDPDHLLSEKSDRGITLLLIPHSTPGLNIGRRHKPMGLAFMNGPIVANAIEVPLDSIIGGIHGIGRGWQMLMHCLAAGRCISLPALASGTAAFCYRATGAYTAIRKQFKRPLSAFEGIAHPLGEIAGLHYLTESARLFSTAILATGSKPAVISAIMKFHMTEIGRIILHKTMDIHGGKALIAGPKNYMTQLYFGTPIAITVEGANILTRSLMIYGQGLFRCHPHVKTLIDALYHENSKEGMRQFQKTLLKEAMHCLRVSAVLLTSHFYVRSQNLQSYKKIYKHYSAALAVCSELCLFSLGGSLKTKEQISARLGDAMSYLLLMLSVFWRAQSVEKNQEHSQHQLFALQYCAHKAEEALWGLVHNHPFAWARALLRVCIFPLGRRQPAPADKLLFALAKTASHDNPFRDTLSYLAKPTHEPDDVMVKLDYLLAQQKNLSEVMQKIHACAKKQKCTTIDEVYLCNLAHDMGVITEEEYQAMMEYHTLVIDIISVDSANKECK